MECKPGPGSGPSLFSLRLPGGQPVYFFSRDAFGPDETRSDPVAAAASADQGISGRYINGASPESSLLPRSCPALLIF